MECAYIQTLKAGALREKDPELQRLMAMNALKHIGAADAMVAKKLQKPSVRAITKKWLWFARGSLLHKEGMDQLADRERKERLANMKVDEVFTG